MLTKKLIIETVTFDGSQAEDYMYPDTSYGDEVEVVIQHHHKEDVDRSVTVRIGDLTLLPEQLEAILKQVQNYKQAAKAFIE